MSSLNLQKFSKPESLKDTASKDNWFASHSSSLRHDELTRTAITTRQKLTLHPSQLSVSGSSQPLTFLHATECVTLGWTTAYGNPPTGQNSAYWNKLFFFRGNSKQLSWLPRTVANRTYPVDVIDFYERRLMWGRWKEESPKAMK